MKLALVLALGAIINIAVALTCDWNANTTTQPVRIASPEEARQGGWSGWLPAESPIALAAWRQATFGVSTDGILAGDTPADFELNVEDNTLTFDINSDINVHAVQDTAVDTTMRLVIESRAGWPMHSLIGRTNLKAKPATTSHPRLNIHVTGKALNVTAGQPQFQLDTLEPTPLHIDEREPIRLNLDGFHIAPQSGISAQTGAPAHDSPENIPSAVTPRENIQIIGRLAIEVLAVRPIPAAANGRWKSVSIVQNFDREYRAWPLPSRPIWIGFAVNSVFYAILIAGLVATPFVLRSWLRSRRGLCSRCAYDLRGANHEHCPECGTRSARVFFGNSRS